MSNIDAKIEEFLKRRPDTIYSIKTIAKNLNIRKRKVFNSINNNKNIISCHSYDVGSSKSNLKLYKLL